MRRLLLIVACLVVGLSARGAEKTITDSSRWPGSRSTLDTLAPFTTAVIACTSKGDAETVKRHSSHMSTAMDMGGGRVISGGGTVTYAYCRQKFTKMELLQGETKAEERVLEYGYVEKSDAFPGPRVERVIPPDTRVILLLGKEGKIMKVLSDTKENREAVQAALSRYQERQEPIDGASQVASPDRSPAAPRPSVTGG